MSDENHVKDEIAELRNAHGYPDLGPATFTLDFSDPPSDEELSRAVNNAPAFACYLMPLPPDMPDNDVAKVRQFVRALIQKPTLDAPAPEIPRPEPETDDERRERLFHSSVSEYAHAATLYALQVCTRRDNGGRPIPTTPAETSLMVAENRRLMEQLVENTRDLGYTPEAIYSAASEAEREISTSIVQEATPYVPDPSLAIQAFYTNWKGMSRVRRIIPIGLWYGATEYHPQEQHLLDVFDLDKNEKRTYALAGFPGIVIPEILKKGD